MEGTLAEIRMFAGNFAPRGWQNCNGQLLSIAQWTAVFALVGTTYGGDGQTTFGIPDLRGRVAVGAQFSQGPGLPAYQLGEMAGTPTKTLLATNMPVHNHSIAGSVNMQINNDTIGLTDDANGRRFGAFKPVYTSETTDLVNMAADANTLNIGLTGGNQPFSTMPPYLGMNYIFCVEGIFPSRN